MKTLVGLLAVAYVVASQRTTSLCSDRSSSCSAWAMDGHCDGENAIVVRNTCPASCRICEPGCRDAEPNCASWQRQGQCEENPDHMLKHCPQSCGVCTLTSCEDRLASICDPSQCGSEVMLRLCPSTCGVCRATCLDRHVDCSNWARESQCFENPGFALATCPRSCGVCTDGCADFNVTQCAIWGETECQRNPGAMLRDCPATCGVCTNACVDKSASCQAWSENGECDSNPLAMSVDCSNACGICSVLADFKDEL